MYDIDKIRAKIVADYPLFSTFMFGMEMIEDDTVRTICTNGVEIRYNTDYMDNRNPQDQFFLTLHEIAHVFLGHHLRIRPEHKQGIIQKAADYAVNDLLKDCNLQLPYDALWSHQFTGMAMEDIYTLLNQNDDGKQHNPGKHGEVKPGEEDNQDQKDGQPPPGQEQKIKAQLKQHEQKQQESIQTAKMMGNMPATLQRRLDKLTETKTDWKQLLPDLIQDAMGMDDYTFDIPDRRYDTDFILPGMVGEKRGIIVLAVDTSCSISKEQLKGMANEVMTLITEAKPEKTYVIWCDAQVNNVQEFDGWDEPKLEPKGGGGTDFRPPFEYVEDHDIQPTTLVYLTDGYCYSFPKEPDYPVIWVIWQDDHAVRIPFGKVVVM